jgi:hypothetical protein
VLVSSLVEFGHAMPAENRGALAAGLALCGSSATRGAAVLLLLDPDRVVRRAVAGALATVASSLSPADVRRLVAMPDLYTAVTTGLVDVQDNSLSVFRLVRLQDVHKFILLSGHRYAVGVLGINNAFYAQLSPAEGAAVDAGAVKAIAFNREGSRKAEQEAVAVLRTAGVKFIGLSSQQKQEFQKITQGPVIEWLKTQIGVPGLIDEALSAAQAAR